MNIKKLILSSLVCFSFIIGAITPVNAAPKEEDSDYISLSKLTTSKEGTITNPSKDTVEYKFSDNIIKIDFTSPFININDKIIPLETEEINGLKLPNFKAKFKRNEEDQIIVKSSLIKDTLNIELNNTEKEETENTNDLTNQAPEENTNQNITTNTRPNQNNNTTQTRPNNRPNRPSGNTDSSNNSNNNNNNNSNNKPPKPVKPPVTDDDNSESNDNNNGNNNDNSNEDNNTSKPDTGGDNNSNGSDSGSSNTSPEQETQTQDNSN